MTQGLFLARLLLRSMQGTQAFSHTDVFTLSAQMQSGYFDGPALTMSMSGSSDHMSAIRRRLANITNNTGESHRSNCHKGSYCQQMA